MSGVRVKICGIRDLPTARTIGRCHVDAAGFVFAESPRRVAPEEALRIAGDLPEGVERVAVFRLAEPDVIRRVLERFAADRIQVEVTDRLARAGLGARLLPVVHDDGTLPAQLGLLPPEAPVLLEAAGRGGRGRRPDWNRAATLARGRPVWLAGGLTPGSVAEAIRRVRPRGVDVSSGVESSPGIKSARLIEAFVDAVQEAAVQGIRR